MKILLAFPRPLVPADTGGKIRSLQIFSRLSERAEIHAISQADPELDGEGIQEMRRMFASYTPVFWKESVKYSPGFYLDLVKNRFTTMPYFIDKFCRPEFTNALGNLAESHRFDVLFCDFLQTATPALALPMRPRVVFQHNVEYMLRKRQWEAETAPLKKWIFATEWKRTRAIEAQVCRSFDRIIAVSDEDRLAFERDFAARNVSTIATGVDADYFHPQNAPERPGRLVFVGSMDWYPNEDGILWFLREVFPRIQGQIPDVSLAIVGRNPSAALATAASKLSGIALTGRVADVRPYLAEATAVIVPLRVGGGTRIKIPEAMAMGKAVVSTRIGAEGLPFDDRREILLADEPETFAASVVDLLQNAELRAAIGEAAHKRVVRDHGWESVVHQVEETLLKAKGGPGAFVDALPSKQMASLPEA
jgi:glycosyltransferase involved in cell wall biosynthesis